MKSGIRHLLACLLALGLVFVTVTAFAEPVTVTSAEALQNAVNAVNAGGEIEITLGANITGSITIPEGKEVKLNLNDHTLTNTDGQHTITNNGTLTITGSGTVDNVSHARGAIYNNAGATATLDGGTYTRSKENGQSTEDNGGNSWYTIKNFGTMTINEKVEVTQNGHYSSLLANGWYDGNNALKENGSEPKKQGDGATLTINGGTFSGGLNTIKNDDFGILTINGGIFENVTQAALQNWNVATITGGFFDADQTAILNTKADNTMDKGQLTITGGEFIAKTVLGITDPARNVGTVEISGGEFEGGVSISANGAGTVSITGGSFVSDLAQWNTTNATVTVSGGRYTEKVPEEYVVEGMTSVVLTDDEDSSAYYIGTPEEVAAAVADAEAGDKITVLAGDLTLSNPAVGVTVENQGDGTVKAGSENVAKDGSVTIPAPVVTAKPTTQPTTQPTVAPTAKPVPKTGDSSQPFLWAGLLLVSAAAAAAFLLYRKRCR